MLIILKEYKIKGRSFQSTQRIERMAKPVTYLNKNASFTMFHIAKAQFPQIDIMKSTGKVSGRLNIVEGNLKAILPIMESVLEIDIVKNGLLLAE